MLDRFTVDLGAKEQFSEAYAKINPRRVVPTLVLEDGTAIGEVPRPIESDRLVRKAPAKAVT